MNQCKTCGTPLLIKATKRKPEQLTKPFYYSHYYFCPRCKKMYLNEKFKVINENFGLFTKHPPVFGEADVDIWTDGACRSNGSQGAKAAWAFVSGEYEASGLVEGKQTNNTAEAYAVYYALLWASEKGYQNIRVYTDSQITIHGLLKPAEKVKENKEIFLKIAEVIRKNTLSVDYIKVPGHADDENNNRADKLANTLAGLPS